MFLQFFGLKDNPFKLGFEPNCLFLGKHHEEALAHLRYAIAEGEGFTVITGANGAGKSTVCRAFVESLKNECAVSFLSSPIAGPKELLQRLNHSFGIPASLKTPHELIDALNGFLMRERVAGRKVVVFIDDAQILTSEVLEQIRLISNLETTREKLIQIVLIGESALMQLLDSHQLRQMGQRVSVRYEIGALTPDETAAYIQHRLSVASTGSPVRFSRDAVRGIFRYARGNPRRINIACSAILAAAFKARQKEMAGELAHAVIRDLEQLEGKPITGPAPGLRPAWALAGAVLLLLGTAVLLWLRPGPAPPLSGPPVAEPHAAASVPIAEPPLPPSASEPDSAEESAPAAENPPEIPHEPKPAISGEIKRPAMTHSVQIGAYLYPENAQQVAAQLNAKGYHARVMKITDAKGRIWHTVRIGDHPSRQAAQAQADDFHRREQKPSVIRPYGAY